MFEKVQKENEALKKENSTLKTENMDLVTNNVAFKVRNNTLRTELRESNNKKNYFFNRSNHFRKIVLAQRQGQIPKKAQDYIVRQRLKNHLSTAQLDIYLNKGRTSSKKWTDLECSKAMEIAGGVASETTEMFCNQNRVGRRENSKSFQKTSHFL